MCLAYRVDYGTCAPSPKYLAKCSGQVRSLATWVAPGVSLKLPTGRSLPPTIATA